MNLFEADLRRAQARQWQLYLLGAFAFGLAALAIAIGLIFAYGTVIVIVPEDAAVGGTVTVVDGRALAINHTVYGFAAAPEIVVVAPGFREERRRLGPDAPERTVTVALTPLPGRIVATVDPPRDNTRWMIDGEPVGLGSAIDSTVEAGDRLLGVDSPWHPLVEQRVTVGRGGTATLTITLPPLDARLDIASIPAGAAVTFDGATVGTTPLSLPTDGGRHAVSVALDGYVGVEETIELSRGAAAAARTYRLRAGAAMLSVAVEPVGGDLLLDGHKIAPLRDYNVASDRDHTLSYLRAGWHGVSQRLRLDPGETRRVTLRLARDIGTVEINARPAAMIVVDGKPVGEGRATLSLSAVPHRIELRKEGYRTVVRTVTPNSDRPVIVDATLQSELDARIAEAPRSYRNTAGIELLLFEPADTFTMGAPRGQEGQRANEFERRVALAKRFYAGKYEITNTQYRQFRSDHPGADSLPATGISWAAAAAFCNWLSERENLTPFYVLAAGKPAHANPTADGYRLLTEAEWEWLARRAGRPRQTVFPWGDETAVPNGAGNIADEAANGLTRYYVPNYTDGHARAAPIGSYPVEASGVHDLTGNVSEWVHDYYALSPPPAGMVFRDPVGPVTGDTHVVKGSSWRSGRRTTLRAAFRDGLATPRDDVGIRIGRYLYGAETIEAGTAGGR